MSHDYSLKIEMAQAPPTIMEMLLDNISRKIDITKKHDNLWFSHQPEFDLFGFNVEPEEPQDYISEPLGLLPTVTIIFGCSSLQVERAYLPIIKSATKFMLNSTDNAVLLYQGESVMLMHKDGRYIHNRQFDVWAQFTGLIEEDPELDALLKTNFHDEFIPTL